MIDVSSYLYNLNARLPSLLPDELADIERLLQVIIMACDLTIERRGSHNATLSQIRRYAERKLNEDRAPAPSAQTSEQSLRDLRNALVHGGTLNKFSEPERRYLEEQLWSALEKSAPRWNTSELKSFLSYCIPHNGETTAQTSSGVIRYFHTAFSKLPEEYRERSFKELIVRIFSDPTLREHFDGSRRTV